MAAERMEGLWGWAAVMAYTGLPARVIRELVKSEGLPVFEVGDTIYTTKPLIKAWIARRMQAHARHGVTRALAYRYDEPLDDAENRAIEMLALAATAKKRGLWKDAPDNALFQPVAPGKARRRRMIVEPNLVPPKDERG